MEKPRRSQGLTISSLASSKGGIYMNPDGGLLYLNPIKQEIAKQETSQSEPGQLILPVFGDDELAFFINKAQ